MVYAGVFVLLPRIRPTMAGAAGIVFCWLVEFLRLTGLPAVLSERSLVARLTRVMVMIEDTPQRYFRVHNRRGVSSIMMMVRAISWPGEGNVLGSQMPGPGSNAPMSAEYPYVTPRRSGWRQMDCH